MNISNKMMGLDASRQLLMNQLKLQTSLQQLSSGYRINSAADDAAGLGVSERMRAQQTGLERAMMNAQDGNSMVSTAEGALGEVNNMLTRLKELSIQASNGTLSNDDRSIINKEAKNILGEIDRIAQGTNFNGVKLLDGSLVTEKQVDAQGVGVEKIADSLYLDESAMTVFDGADLDAAKFSVNGKDFALVDGADFDAQAAALAQQGVEAIRVDGSVGDNLAGIADQINASAGTNFEAVDGGSGIAMQVGGGINLQVGTTNQAYDQVTVSIGDMTAKGLGLDKLDLSTLKGAQSALGKISTALSRVSSTRGELGATENRLNSAISNLGVTHENITASESKLRDADMARSFMNFTRKNILSQVGISMMAQSNMLTQSQMMNLLR